MRAVIRFTLVIAVLVPGLSWGEGGMSGSPAELEPLGVFDGRTDVGTTGRPGSADYDSTAQVYLIEGSDAGFTSIPRGMYWGIVTLTTVGYGDIHPITPLGQALAAMVMVMGYGIIAVPTGIVTVELAHQARSQPQATTTNRCSECGHREADEGASFCRYCGTPLGDRTP